MEFGVIFLEFYSYLGGLTKHQRRLAVGGGQDQLALVEMDTFFTRERALKYALSWSITPSQAIMVESSLPNGQAAVLTRGVGAAKAVAAALAVDLVAFGELQGEMPIGRKLDLAPLHGQRRQEPARDHQHLRVGRVPLLSA